MQPTVIDGAAAPCGAAMLRITAGPAFLGDGAWAITRTMSLAARPRMSLAK